LLDFYCLIVSLIGMWYCGFQAGIAIEKRRAKKKARA
jgi:hypothetical protein